MVSGPMRIVLWILGSLGVLWALFWLFAFTAMSTGGGGTMGGEGMMRNGAGPEGMMGEMSMQAGAMMGGMVTQTLGMLGLIGIFIYLVADTVRNRP